MKKVLLIAFSAFMMSTSSVSAQVLEKGNVMIDLYYGYPNVSYATFLLMVDIDQEKDYNIIGGVGPLGISGEYMLADKIGLGVDMAYNSTSLSGSKVSSVYNETTMIFEDVTYEYELRTAKFGAMVTFNYHFVNTDALDVYCMVGAGYKHINYTSSGTEPNYNGETATVGVIPVASRFGLGIRFFFTDNIGLNLGVGLGQGGIIKGGFTVKF
jgi:opacity protein-like surface antigen